VRTPSHHGNEDTPPADKVRELIRREDNAREEQRAKIEKALRDSHCAKSMAANFGWKLNFILVGVGATFLAVGALVAWTVARVDQIEARTRGAAVDDARRVAYDVVREELKAWGRQAP
jgi:hypothetical protein